MSDGFFDMPAGFNDADLEMAALEDLGNRARKRYRALGYPKDSTNLDRIRAGETIESPRKSKDTGENYTVLVRMIDADEVGPILAYALPGKAVTTWHENARAAYCAG